LSLYRQQSKKFRKAVIKSEGLVNWTQRRIKKKTSWALAVAD